MLDPEFLQMLVCPEDKTSLRLATAEELQAVNEGILSHSLQNLGGQEVREVLMGGLVRTAGDRLYPIREEIPVLLVEEAIALR